VAEGDTAPMSMDAVEEDDTVDNVVDDSPSLSEFCRSVSGLCMAPVRQHVPAELWKHLPNWFLDAAVLDNYTSERLLLDHFGEKFEHTFVSTAGNRTQHVTYHSVNPAVTRLQKETHPALFDIMLSFGIVKHIETGFNVFDNSK